MAGIMRRLFIVVVSVLLFLALACQAWKTAPLSPPPGNSIHIKSLIKGGKYVYACQGQKWVPVMATAQLVNVSDSQQLLGNYSLQYKANRPYFLGNWYFYNADTIVAESAQSLSTVSAQIIASEPSDKPNSLPQVLAQATYHQYYGMASQVSYIQRLFTEGGLPPSKTCNSKTNIAVPFKGQFWFYTQDSVPPSMPKSIQCPSSQKVVTAFFCNGVVTYTFTANAWRRTSIFGKLYNLPGGNFVGTFYLKKQDDAKSDDFCIDINNPYGWTVTAKLSASATVASDSLPWALFQVNSSSGYTNVLGPFSYFQMVGTRGGVAPSTKKKTEATYRSPFCSQIWVYSSK